MITPINNIKVYNKENYPQKFNAKPSALKTSEDCFIKNQLSFKGDGIYRLYPLAYFYRKLFERSVKVSRVFFDKIDKDLMGKVKQIKLKTPDNNEIFAWEINPKRAKKYIIYLHGTAQNITKNQELYKKVMKETKYGLLIPEYSGYGKNPIKKRISENTMTKDAQTAIDYLKSKKIKPQNIGIVGHSVGGFITAKLAKNNPDIGFNVLISPVNSLNLVGAKLMKSKSGGLPEILRKFLQKNPIFLKPFTKVYRASKEIKKSNIKTFVIHCKTDKQVGIKEVDDLVSNIKNLSEYVILPRGGHRMEEFKIASLVDILNKK